MKMIAKALGAACALSFMLACLPVDSQIKGLDASATIACRDFRRLIRDTRAGVLTGPEMRERMKDIRANARVSKSHGIAPAADDLLRAMTSGTPESIQSGMEGMVNSCNGGRRQ